VIVADVGLLGATYDLEAVDEHRTRIRQRWGCDDAVRGARATAVATERAAALERLVVLLGGRTTGQEQRSAIDASVILAGPG
jgi:hypothetical protein